MDDMARTKMTDDEKNARRAVRDYLEAIEANKPRRGRKRTPDSIAKRLEAIESDFADASALKRLELAQERIDLGSELASMDESIDMEALEAGFVEHAKWFGAQKTPPITYAAWREVGVSAATLKAAGVSRAG